MFRVVQIPEDLEKKDYKNVWCRTDTNKNIGVGLIQEDLEKEDYKNF